MEVSQDNTNDDTVCAIVCVVLSFIADSELGGRAREMEMETETERARVQARVRMT